MKKQINRLFLLSVLSVTLSSSVVAAPVTFQSAKTAALNFYLQNSGKAVSTVSLAYTELSSGGIPEYYVFNMNANDGFVIVSAEDAAKTIIGYSLKGQFISSDLPDQFTSWMNGYKRQIEAIRANNFQADDVIKSQWNAYLNNVDFKNPSSAARTDGAPADSINPLVHTTWEQSSPYNLLCPVHSGAQAITGCVATAMAQIMRFWNFPATGTSSYQYVSLTDSTVPMAHFDTTHYHWSEMPLSLGSGSTGKEDTAVSLLMYHCGVAVEMQYSPGGSGAEMLISDVQKGNSNAQLAYATFFGYNPNTLQGLRKASYTDSSWIAALKNELNNRRPLQYEATGSFGHSWVCDGYDLNSMFDMNWGWGGSDNGYYAIGALNPGTDELNNTNAALIGIEPLTTAGISGFITSGPMNVYPNPGNGLFTFNSDKIPAESVLEVYNTTGQIVFRTRVNGFYTQVSLCDQPAGVYLYRVLGENSQPISTGKLIVR